MPRLRKVFMALLLCATCVWGCAPGQVLGIGGSQESGQTVNQQRNATPAQGSTSTPPPNTGSNPTPSKSGSPDTAKPTPPPRPVYPTLSAGQTGTSVLRLQQLLAQEGYLPLNWKASNPSGGSTNPIDPTAFLQSPPEGTFSWRYENVPSWAKSMWKPGNYTLLVKSAVMTYQQANHLSVDGVAGPQVWSTLIANAGRGKGNPFGLTYVQVNMKQPQTLTVWWNGKQVLRTLVNTGIRQSPTVTGTYPVYLQYRSQRMSGTDPWGNHYDDPGVPYVSYFYGGEAIHGFVRAQYGYPQSLGCVELPVKNAAVAWQYVHYGTLVHLS